MLTSLERIRAKISELEEKLTNLRIAERELVALENTTSQKAERGRKPKREQEQVAARSDDSAQMIEPQTMTTTIVEILTQHEPLTVPAIAQYAEALGRDISNRAISFTLQALKKRGLVKSEGREWTLIQARRKSRKA